MKKTYQLAELFCGPGGLALGAKWAGFSHSSERYAIDPCWAIDIDESACRTYHANIHSSNSNLPTKVICGDIRKVFADEPNIPPFDALAFGFPCNDFSIVGEQLGFGGAYGPLYSYGVKAITKYKPVWFVAENVGGIRNANEGQAFKTILKELVEAGSGYCLTAHLYKFEEYKVPQARHRVVIVGMRRDLGIDFQVPATTSSKLTKQVTAKIAITCPPIPDETKNHEFTRQSSAVVERLKMLPPGENAWHIDKLLAMDNSCLTQYYATFPELRQLCPDVNFLDPKSIRQKLHNVKLNVKSARMSQIYKRLEPNRPAYTITGSGGGGTHGYHWAEPRALTNRERARLQTFPDNFVFHGSKEEVRKQIGMAVPPLGAKLIFRAILQSLAGVQYSHCEPNIGVFRTSGDVDRALEKSALKQIANKTN